MTTAQKPVIAIIGGGFGGATLAYHLTLKQGVEAQVVVIEPREGLGQGLAYSTTDPSHRINVPAARMTMDSGDLAQFQHWLDRTGVVLDGEAEIADGIVFAQRRLVGDYLAQALAPVLEDGRVRHWRTVALKVEALAEGFEITGADGATLQADHLVIATSHPPPSVPEVFARLMQTGRVLPGTGDTNRLYALAKGARRVLVVGTGLTAGDAVASLDRMGFEGEVRMLSRRGQRSRPHRFGYEASKADFGAAPSGTALGLLQAIRQAVREDEAKGLPWQATLDHVRRDAPKIWQGLNLKERQRLVRHLRVWWDVHRFRIAPQVDEVIDQLADEGRLSVVAGRLKGARDTGEGLEVIWQARGASGPPVTETFDAVILTTGPAHGGIMGSSPLFKSLGQQGLARADACGLGLDVQDRYQAVGADGQVVPRLYVSGPLARSDVGELMGIPEVTLHAEGLAARLAQVTAVRELA